VTHARPDDDGLVFTSPGGGPLRHTNFRRRFWVPALAAAGLPAMHFHDLRHTGNMLAGRGRESPGADGADGALHDPGRDGVPARRDRAPAGHRGRAEQAGSGTAGPVEGEAIGHATGTTAPDGIMTAWPVCGNMLPDLGLRVCAPTATRTRDLLLRRHFRSVALWCQVWPDKPFSRTDNCWT